MIKYGDLVQYIKDNHVNWNTDLFEVLRGFFEQHSFQPQQDTLSHSPFEETAKEAKAITLKEVFTHPADGEYTTKDLLNLFST